MWVIHWGLLLRLSWRTWVCPSECQVEQWCSCLGHASGPEETWRLQPREAAGRPQAGLNLKFNSEPTPQNSWSSTRFSPKLSPKRLLLPNVNSLQATFPLSSPTKTGHSSSGAHPGIHTRQSRKDKVLSGPSWSVRSVLGKAQVLSII